MRWILSLSFVFLSLGAFAQTKCDRYQNNARYMKAIETVAASLDFKLEELCHLEKVMDIEAQPTHITTLEGEVIPHVRVQLHMAYESCLYLVRDSDQFISKNYCYSGF